MTGAARPHDSVRRLTVVVALLSTLGAYTIDAFFPSMRAMAAEFGVSYWTVQQTLTVYMIPYGFFSLLHGSLSDALGRRRVVLVGLALYAVASAGCALAPTFGALLVFRFLQGVGGGVGMIIGRAVVRDRYSGAQAQRVMSAITIMFSLGPALAPVIGGWVHVWFGWRAVFGSMAIYGLVLTLLVLRQLPESLPVSKRTPLQFGALVRNMVGVARHAEFLLLTAASSLSFVALQTYIGAAPAIIMDHWHGSETGFAMLTIPIITGHSIGGFLSGRLAGRLPPARQANYGYTMLLVATGAMLALQSLVREPPIIIQQLLLAGTALGLQLMFPIVTLRVLDLFAHARGAATSAHSFCVLMCGAVVMGLLSPWLSVSLERLALTAFAANLAGWLVWRLARRHQRALGAATAEAGDGAGAGIAGS